MEKANANIIFSLDGKNKIIQCSKEDKIEDICHRYANKVNIDINSLIFLYGGNQLKLELSFKDQANSIDNNNNEMRVLVYKIEDIEFNGPKSDEIIKGNTENLDDIIIAMNNIEDTINEVKLIIDNIIKNSSLNDVNIQLKNISIRLTTINEDIIKQNEKLKNILNNSLNNRISDFQNKNTIEGELDKEINGINNNITLFNTDTNNKIEVYLNNKKINMIKEGKQWKIKNEYIKNDEKYQFKIMIYDEIISLSGFFEECSNITSLDLSNLNTSNVSDMYRMFHNCNKLKKIKGLDKLITNKVVIMSAMFQECRELEYLDLSDMNTSNVVDMSHMFHRCHKLKEIKGINKFITDKVRDMNSMFSSCYKLEHLDIYNFNTSNINDMSFMFSKCYNLEDINGIDKFITNKVGNMKSMFQACFKLEYLDLSNFNTSNVIDMSYMFNKCNKLKEIKGINKFITDKVINMYAMFQECFELEYLDLSNFNTSNVNSMSYMFNNCKKLKYLNLLNFEINNITENMLSFDQKDKCNFITNNIELTNLFNLT